MAHTKTTDDPAVRRDLDLATRFLSGDALAFTELFHSHHREVQGLVLRMLAGSRRDAEDVVQEVFLQVFRSLPAFKGQSRLSTWVYRVAVNVTLMHRRALRSRPQLHHGEPVELPGEASPLPDELAERARRVAALDRLLDQLSEKKRTVFILHDLQGLSPEQIGQVVGAPVLTVRTRLFYARRELTALIAEDAALRVLFPELTEDSEMSDRGERLGAAHAPIASQGTRGDS